MLRTLILILFTTICCYQASAQQTTKLDSLLQTVPEATSLPLNDVIKHIGDQVYIHDTIMDFKVISPALKKLYIGGKYPNQILTIIIEGEKLNKQTISWFANGVGRFSGKLIIYKKKPAIIISSIDQLCMQVAI